MLAAGDGLAFLAPTVAHTGASESRAICCGLQLLILIDNQEPTGERPWNA